MSAMLTGSSGPTAHQTSSDPLASTATAVPSAQVGLYYLQKCVRVLGIKNCNVHVPYDRVDLQSLRTGDRVGLRLSFDDDLVFSVNGERLGVAATGVYYRGWDVYAAVDHFGSHPATVCLNLLVHYNCPV